MKVKEKPCKGTGKAKDFESCGTLQKFRKYGLGIDCKCYSKWLRESLEGQEMILKASKKAKMYSVVEDRKIYNKEKKDRKWELMSKAQKITEFINLSVSTYIAYLCSLLNQFTFQSPL